MNRRFRREKIAHLPTPLEKLDVLTAELGGPQLYVKRDDQTGLAFGGNKTRKLEFIIADALDKKAEVIITWGGEQSNWCRQTVAAARMFGIKPVLVLSQKEAGAVKYDGNLFLDALLGADIRFVAPGTDRSRITEDVTEEMRAQGHNPYVVAVGGSSVGGSMTEPIGAVSYTGAFLETYNQAQEMSIKVDYLVHASGSGGTQSGLVVGARAAAPEVKVVGISVGGAKAASQRNITEISRGVFEALGLEMTISPEEIIVFDDYVGEGYGVLNQEIADAIRLTARKEGILLDPVYTGKAMAGLMDLIKQGYFKKDDNVIFMHTGGTPALFAYKEQLLEMIK
ncbi:MAG: hypothetical protein AMJ79_01855 [Phycisphaerae bacterium SM23_30]|nr:MAG: hypothetical protein AMJ79_01855 [Phycisphaerae bacterium SM23_30]